MRQAVRDWLLRLLTDGGVEDAERLANHLAPFIEEALKGSGLDMLRQCTLAQFGDGEDVDDVKEWTVSVNDAIAAALRRVEHRRQAS